MAAQNGVIDWKQYIAKLIEVEVESIPSYFYKEDEFFQIEELDEVVMARKRYVGKDDAAQYAAFRNGELIAGPIVQAGNVNRRPILKKVWGELSFGFEYPDRHEDNGRFQVWTL